MREKKREMPGATFSFNIFFSFLSFFFLKAKFPLESGVWNQLDWLANELQAYSYYCLPSPGIYKCIWCTWLFMWVVGIELTSSWTILCSCCVVGTLPTESSSKNGYVEGIVTNQMLRRGLVLP